MFDLTEYQVTLQIHQPVTFDYYPGFVIRNALVKAMTRYCNNPDRIKNQKITNCHGCKNQPKCIYYSLHLPVDKSEATPSPMPFLLDANNLIFGKYEQGKMKFTISLLGIAQIHAKRFGESFDSIGLNYGMGKNSRGGCFRLTEMIEMKRISLNSVSAVECNNSKQFTLHFKHLMLDANSMKNTSDQLPFEKLFHMISHRVKELDVIYGDGTVLDRDIFEWKEMYNDITSTSSFVKCNYEYPSSGKDKGYFFFNGIVELKGELHRVMNLLRLGSQVGIGRFTAYGFGTYSIQYE